MSDGLGPSPSRKRHRLAARWRIVDGRMDTVANLEPRFDNSSLRYIMDVLNDAVRAELERRGYDPASMRFSIDRTAEHAAEVDRQVEETRNHYGSGPPSREK